MGAMAGFSSSSEVQVSSLEGDNGMSPVSSLFVVVVTILSRDTILVGEFVFTADVNGGDGIMISSLS
eukprot:14696278-Ditylum_brightwellii.AAC.1